MIIYFSGTGNSRYTAKRIADITGDQLLCLNDRIKDPAGEKLTTGEKLIFVVPTYAWRIPHITEQWIRDTDFTGTRQVWFVMTCGDEAGNAGKYNRKTCIEKQWAYMGTAQIVMPENYIAMFAIPREETVKKIIRKAEPLIDELAKQIASGQQLPELKVSPVDRIKSTVVNPVFYKLFVKADAFRVTDACISCGRCADICPLGNIVIKESGPVWGHECTHCMACICGCPEEAVEYGHKSVGKPRYYCNL